MKKKLIAIVLAVCSFVGCGFLQKSWPMIIATAQAISSVTGIFYPQVGSLSALAVSLLQDAENAANAYNSDKNPTTEAKFVAAIQTIETELPAAEQKLNIPPADQQKVQAAVSIILDYVEALGAQVPVTQHVVLAARTARTAAPPPKPLSASQIKTRWKAEVCGGEKDCAAKLK